MKCTKKLDIDWCFWVTDQLPLPPVNMNTSLSLRAKIEGGVGGHAVTQKLQLIQKLIK